LRESKMWLWIACIWEVIKLLMEALDIVCLGVEG
jgi:hypothetical protein